MGGQCQRKGGSLVAKAKLGALPDGKTGPVPEHLRRHRLCQAAPLRPRGTLCGKEQSGTSRQVSAHLGQSLWNSQGHAAHSPAEGRQRQLPVPHAVIRHCSVAFSGRLCHVELSQRLRSALPGKSTFPKPARAEGTPTTN